MALNGALAKAQEEKNKSEAIISALGDGIIIQDTDYKIISRTRSRMKYMGTRRVSFVIKHTRGEIRYAKIARLKEPSGMERSTGRKNELPQIREIFILNLLHRL